MKKLNLLLLALFTSAAITSCSNDDDDRVTTGLIVGQWVLSEEGETVETLETAENDGCDLPIYEFFEGGTYNENGYDYNSNSDDCESYSETGKWYKKGSTLTVKDSYDTSKVTILELTETTLKVKSTDQEGDWISVFTRVTNN